MGVISRGTKAGGGVNFNDGQIIDAGEVNTDFNLIYTELTAALDDDNIQTGTIPGAKTLRFTEIVEPAAPTSDDLYMYAIDDGGVTKIQIKDSAGTTTTLGATGGGASVSFDDTEGDPSDVDGTVGASDGTSVYAARRDHVHALATVPVNKGGTNITTYAVGDLLYASGTGALARLADIADGNVLRAGGVGAAPVYGKVRLSGTPLDVTGTLGVTLGGTGTPTAFTAGRIVFAGTGGIYSQDADFVWDTTNERMRIGPVADDGLGVGLTAQATLTIRRNTAKAAGTAADLAHTLYIQNGSLSSPVTGSTSSGMDYNAIRVFHGVQAGEPYQFANGLRVLMYGVSPSDGAGFQALVGYAQVDSGAATENVVGVQGVAVSNFATSRNTGIFGMHAAAFNNPTAPLVKTATEPGGGVYGMEVDVAAYAPVEARVCLQLYGAWNGAYQGNSEYDAVIRMGTANTAGFKYGIYLDKNVEPFPSQPVSAAGTLFYAANNPTVTETRDYNTWYTHGIDLSQVRFSGDAVLVGTSNVRFTARTTPTAPPASQVRLYADTSGGKVRLMARFPSGAAQVVASEP